MQASFKTEDIITAMKELSLREYDASPDAEAWSEHAEKKQVLPPTPGNPVTAKAIRFFKEQPREKKSPVFVYELGCGGGIDTWPYLAEGYTVHAIDPNKRALEVLNERFSEKYGSQLTTERVTLQTATYDQKADIISCVSVFRCLTKKDFSVAWPKVVSAIKENGVLSCDIYGTDHKWYPDYPDHTYLSLDQIKQLFEASHLTIKDLEEYKQEEHMVLEQPVYFHYVELVAQKKPTAPEQEIDEATTARIIGLK